ncbi:neuroendocrine convertase 1-like isoform X2 [Oculina patagonica]
MWFMKLLLILAFSNAFMTVTVRGHRYTNTWVVQINGDINGVNRIAEKYRFTYKMKISNNYYLFENKSLPKISPQPSHIQETGLIEEPLVRWFTQQVRQKRVLYDRQFSVSFNDPRWSEQRWYLNPPDGKGMNIDKVWQQGVTGKGIVVAVVDDGLQQSHPDLKDNYDPSASLDLVDLDGIPDPVGTFSGHGNRCGGVIAASANNSECGVGVAFNAKLGGIRVFGDDDPTDAMEALAFQYKRQYIDIYSCSWGPADTGWTMEGPEQLARDQLEEGTKIGRQGKGSIFVFAAGNGGRDYDNCAYNGYANSVFTITISGVSSTGSIPGYAERCSAIMASTYSQDDVGGVDSIITSDINGTCTSTFSSTSAATAIASGIIALTLEANPKLTWRDIQHLIAYSSNYDVPHSDDWVQNSAGLWVSSYFGFGLMDAAKLVNYSTSWRTVPRQIKCEIPQSRVNRVITRSGYTDLDLTVSEDNCGGQNTIKYLEHVVVIIHARFSRRGYLEGNVTSPSGTISEILPYRPYDVIATDFNNWPILSLHFWGENPQGTWKLRLRNRFPNYKFSGALYNWTLVLHGTASDPLENNLHVSRPFIPRVTTESVNSAVTAQPAGSRHEGLTGTEIALIISAAVLAFIILCVAVVLYKFKVCSRGRKKGATRTSANDIKLSEQNYTAVSVI